MEKNSSYIPALKFHWLTELFDPVMKVVMPEKRFKQILIDEAEIEFHPDINVLDFGCGTATLSIMIKEKYRADVWGIDVDEKILSIAKNKIEREKLNIHLLKYDGTKLPFPSNTFDRVVSSLVFHHLTPFQKGKALEEIYRVLKPNGRLHIADWGKPQNSLLRVPFYLVQLLDGFETTTDSVQGMLTSYMENAGFEKVEEVRQITTLLGALSFYKAEKL